MDFNKRELERICSLGLIDPGDFVVVKELTEYMGLEDGTGEFFFESLYSNTAAHDASSRSPL